MESITREFAEGDRWSCKGFKFEQIDRFGSMPTFTLKGSTKYQTNCGSAITMFYLQLILASIGYYVYIYYQKEPITLYSSFMAPKDANIELNSADTHFYFNAYPLTTGINLKSHEFWPNFNLFASVQSKGHKDQPHTGGRKWTNIPITNCSDTKWVKDLPDTEAQKKFLMEDCFCQNSDKIEIYGGTTPTNHSKLMIDFYTCQPNTNGLNINCVNQIPIYNVLVEFNIMEKSIDVKDYENPIKRTFRRIDSMGGSDVQRYESKFFIKDTELHSNKGQLIAQWEMQRVVTLHDQHKQTSWIHPRNIPLNFLSQGRPFDTDANWHIEVISVKDKVQVYRSYFTFYQLISSVGGLSYSATIFIVALYASYNRYWLIKYILENVILGRPGQYPDEYKIGKRFCSLYWRKCFCCCYSKYDNDKDFQKRKINYKACSLVFNDKMDLQNFVHDGMDFYAMRQLMMKSRHKILMPSLVLHLQKMKTKPGAGYQSSFSRNLHERTDQPCFSFEDAIEQLKNPTYGSKLIEIEKEMDAFFLTYLPQDIIGLHDTPTKCINEFSLKQTKHENMNLKKDYTIANFDTSNKIAHISSRDYNKIQPADTLETNNPSFVYKKNKSDLTLGFVNSGQLVEQLAKDSKKDLMIEIERKKASINLGNVGEEQNSEVVGFNLKKKSVFGNDSVDDSAKTRGSIYQQGLEEFEGSLPMGSKQFQKRASLVNKKKTIMMQGKEKVPDEKEDEVEKNDDWDEDEDGINTRVNVKNSKFKGE